MEDHILVKKKNYKWAKYEFATTSLRKRVHVVGTH